LTKKRPRLAEVDRLLRLKQTARITLLRPDVASSVAAFIAWKALLLAANAENGPNERQRLRKAVRGALQAEPNALRPAVEEFVEGLQRLSRSDVTPMVRRDWFAQEGAVGQREQADDVIRSAKRLRRRLTELQDGDVAEISSELVDRMCDVRNAVIGHVRVTTETPFFGTIVTPFETLAASVAECLFRRANP
jgi:hypothetical protein